MERDAECINKPSWWRVQARPALAAAAAIAATLLVAACGGGSNGPGVAGAGRSATTPARSSSKAPTKATALAYSRCMRAHGVPNFPDPNSNGQIQLQAGPDNGLGPDSPAMQSASQACKSLEPTVPIGQQRRDFAKALTFAKCVRSHGVPGFPDPQPPGSGPTTQSQKGQGQGDTTPQFDPASPPFKAAMQACQKYAPGGGAGFTTHAQGAPS
jgi:hypothetical protein